MKLNAKGFTLLEILATLTIVAILSTIAVGSVIQFQEYSREKDYEAIEKSVYNACQNYVTQTGYVVKKETDSGYPSRILVSTLVSSHYLDNVQDPGVKGGLCQGSDSYVEVTKAEGSSSKLDQYQYKVHVVCRARTLEKTFVS